MKGTYMELDPAYANRLSTVFGKLDVRLEKSKPTIHATKHIKLSYSK
jgi:hypothetical protein